MATAIAGVSCSPIIIKALVQLAEFGQPPSCQKTASGKQPYHWRHEIAAGWREKFNFKPRKAVPHSQKATLSVHILCRSWIQTEDEDSVVVLPWQIFQEPSTKGLTGDWNSKTVLYSTQREVSPIQWLLSMAYLTPAEGPRKRTGESELS